jgi:hypothetical protein
VLKNAVRTAPKKRKITKICDGSRGDLVRVQLHLVVVTDVKVGQIIDAYPC